MLLTGDPIGYGVQCCCCDYAGTFDVVNAFAVDLVVCNCLIVDVNYCCLCTDDVV